MNLLFVYNRPQKMRFIIGECQRCVSNGRVLRERPSAKTAFVFSVLK
ncbi:nesp039 [Neophasia sp. alphabaculovirus]|nr:nesp039 [Neophasia sp. alphabaculovirus]